jgi:hypothetical protein
MCIFSWGARGYRNVHTDLESAAASGLDRTLMQAQQQTAFVTEAMTNFFGPPWLTTGDLDMRFVSPAFADDRLTPILAQRIRPQMRHCRLVAQLSVSRTRSGVRDHPTRGP